MKKITQRLCISFCAIVFLFGLVRLYYRLTDDFRIANMTYELPFRSDWEIEKPSADEWKKLEAMLDQSFSYIGKGAQSYAFLSQDQRYVIKFFKFKHLKPNWLVNILPDIFPFHEYKTQNIARKERLFNSVFSGYKLGYDVHREESALLFIHLNKTSYLKRQVKVFDKIGRSHDIDLDQTIFVLQENVTSFRTTLQEALARKDLQRAAEKIDRMLSLYLSEYEKGIYDRDHGVLHNTGFIGERPVHLDLGKMSRELNMRDPKTAQTDLALVVAKIQKWLDQNYPQYTTALMEPAWAKLQSMSKEPQKSTADLE